MRKLTHLSQSKLLERGWTKTMIDQVLGEPDMFKPNPAYKSAAPMRLYSIGRIEAAESHPYFADYLTVVDKRRKAIQPSIDQRRTQTLAEVKSLHIRIKKVALEHCQREAVESYNAFNNPIDPVDLNDVKKRNPDFLDRITVNQIRHNRTCYDQKLVEQAGKIGVTTAQEIVRAKVYKAIMEAYPELAGECLRQLDYRECDIGLAA